MAKIAIFGSNGQLGHDLVKVLKQTKHELILLKRDFLDVEDTASYAQLENLSGVDYILNCIAYNRVDDAEDCVEKAFKINSFFPRELGRFCKKNDITLFHFSTDYVFDGKKDQPYEEMDHKLPQGVYGSSKSMGEDFVKVYSEKYFIFRVSSLFGVAGSSGKGGNFIETMLKMARENKEIRVVSDQKMSPTHTMDVARTVLAFIDDQNKEYGIYHVCNSGSCSWYEFADLIFQKNNLKPNLNPVLQSDFVTKAIRPKMSIMNNQKTKRFYELKSWEEALQEYFDIKNNNISMS